MHTRQLDPKPTAVRFFAPGEYHALPDAPGCISLASAYGRILCIHASGSMQNTMKTLLGNPRMHRQPVTDKPDQVHFRETADPETLCSQWTQQHRDAEGGDPPLQEEHP